MVRGRPSRGAAYASGIRHPPHHLTPKSLMNAKFLAEVYQSLIREHGKRVKKTRARTHKSSMGHTVDLQLPMSYIYKYYYEKVLTYYMGSEAQTTNRLSSPPCGSSAASNSAMGGMSACSFAARTVANSSAVAAASSRMVDAASASASVGTTYPDDTLWRSMM